MVAPARHAAILVALLSSGCERTAWQSLADVSNAVRCSRPAAGAADTLALGAGTNLGLLESTYAQLDGELDSLVPLAEAYLVSGFLAEELGDRATALARHQRGAELTEAWVQSRCPSLAAPTTLDTSERIQGPNGASCHRQAIAARVRGQYEMCLAPADIQPFEFLAVFASALHRARALWVTRGGGGDECARTSSIAGALDYLARVEVERPDLFEQAGVCACSRGMAHAARILLGIAQPASQVSDADRAEMERRYPEWLGQPLWLSYQSIALRGGLDTDGSAVSASAAERYAASRASICSGPVHDLMDRIAALRFERWALESEDSTLPGPLLLQEIVTGRAVARVCTPRDSGDDR